VLIFSKEQIFGKVLIFGENVEMLGFGECGSVMKSVGYACRL
jgi:hypothetical protein